MNMHDSDNRNDALLLQQVAAGNAKSFEVLYEKYWGKTYSDAFKRLKDSDQAKDVVQEILPVSGSEEKAFRSTTCLHTLPLPYATKCLKRWQNKS